MDRSSGEDKSQGQSITENIIEQKLLERIEQTRALKAQEFSQVQKQSFILKKSISDKRDVSSTFQNEQDIDNLIDKIDRYQTEKQEVQNLHWSDKKYWKYVLKNNTDLFSLLILESSLMLGVYPLLTLKTRVQARHKSEDVCFFFKNNVKKAPLYPGISQALYSLSIGNIVNSSAARLAMVELQENSFTKKTSLMNKQTIASCFGDIVSAPFRIFFEVRRMNIQMNSFKINHDDFSRAMRRGVLPLLVRDLLFRIQFTIFNKFFLYSEHYYQKWNTNDQREKKYIQNAIDRQSIPASYNRQSSSMIAATFIGIVASNPIDVVFTRLSCQQYHKYTGFVNCLKTIYKEEGLQKLFLSGFSYRFAYYLINGSIMLNMYDSFRGMFREAYE